jgi:hypothetical protein
MKPDRPELAEPMRAYLDSLPRQELEALLCRLTRYAERLAWRTKLLELSDAVAAGKTATGIVDEVIDLVLRGRRVWDQKKEPEDFLRLAIWSHTMDLRKKYARLLKNKRPHETLEFDLTEDRIDITDHNASAPDLALESVEEYRTCKRFLADFFRIAKKMRRDPNDASDMERILDARLDGCETLDGDTRRDRNTKG